MVITTRPPSLPSNFLQEVVSLGGKFLADPAKLPDQTAIHLLPEHWHALLQADDAGCGKMPPVLLDARNIYETRIGHFSSVRSTSHGDQGL